MTATINLLDTSIDYLKGVGPKRAEVFRREFNIFTYEDLLYYYPYRHVDKSKIYNIGTFSSEGVFVQFRGKVLSYEIVGQQRARRLVAHFSDNTGTMELVWFNSLKWVEDLLKARREFIVFGKPALFNGHWSITHPEMIDPQMQDASQLSMSFQPLYNTSDKAKKNGLDSKAISKLMISLLIQIKDVIRERLSPEIIQQHKLLTLSEALVHIHYPASFEILKRAQIRLKFDELFFTQLKLLKTKQLNTQHFKGHIFSIVGDNFNIFYKNCLPFDFTNAQKRVIKEIRSDMGSGRQMNRLLQGDVGSGKTITALLLMLIAKDNGFQSCLMAPTEILAQQHFNSITQLLKEMNLKVEFLSGSTRAAKRHDIHKGIANSTIDILIGTHALIEDNVIFNNLGFVVIDEQHRFGVEQRAKLWKKNTIPPHILVMTATPIPRTLAMTLYGDLDLSVIDELPRDRKPVITCHFFENSRNKMLGVMRSEIAKGRQVFVVYPLIKESEKLDLLDLMAGYEAMAREFPLPQYQLGIVHGKMKAEEKEFEMQRFIRKETHILLSTTVIEVGIDVPNATIMVIENAERFGLSQLHQLRGRVGRGGEQSYCILMTGNKLSSESHQRMHAMVSSSDGFEIANIDLKLRGPGDLQGTQQSGTLDFKIADLVKDEKMVVYTRKLAMHLLEFDPELKSPSNALIAAYLREIMQKSLFWGLIS
ncbi:MAG: ATP-dependent DNA helicase RecG [Bacteroidales bacterium]|jgi:ATP-dependent DNA helicase RecG|nr:ATP-dependent DNA helicase RecG [Bacteroidales bacterium]